MFIRNFINNIYNQAYLSITPYLYFNREDRAEVDRMQKQIASLLASLQARWSAQLEPSLLTSIKVTLLRNCIRSASSLNSLNTTETKQFFPLYMAKINQLYLNFASKSFASSLSSKKSLLPKNDTNFVDLKQNYLTQLIKNPGNFPIAYLQNTKIQAIAKEIEGELAEPLSDQQLLHILCFKHHARIIEAIKEPSVDNMTDAMLALILLQKTSRLKDAFERLNTTINTLNSGDYNPIIATLLPYKAAIGAINFGVI